MRRGNGMSSRMWCRPVIHATVRSMPRPNPEWGKVPNRRRSRYQSYASSGRPSSAIPSRSEPVEVVFALTCPRSPRRNPPARAGRRRGPCADRPDSPSCRTPSPASDSRVTKSGSSRSDMSWLSSAAPRSLPPLHLGPRCAQLLDGLRVAHAREGRLHELEHARVPLQHVQLDPAPLQGALHDVRDELLLETHVVARVCEGDLGARPSRTP